MKLEKAIETMENETPSLSEEADPDFYHAFKLLIEAGKAILTYREGPMGYLYLLLPGETPEPEPHGGLPLGGITLKNKGGTK